MPNQLIRATYYVSDIATDEPITEARLLKMGFDVRRLGFYAWLVDHGKESRTGSGPSLAAELQD